MVDNVNPVCRDARSTTRAREIVPSSWLAWRHRRGCISVALNRADSNCSANVEGNGINAPIDAA